MNANTETLDGAYVVVTTRATGRVRLQLGHAMFMPIDKTEMSAQQARNVAQALIQAAVLLDLNAGNPNDAGSIVRNAGAGDRGTVSPQRQDAMPVGCGCATVCEHRPGCKRWPPKEAGRMELRVGLLIAATAASVYLYLDFLGTAVGWW